MAPDLDFVDDPARRALWDERAQLGELAGTQDRMAKRLEVATLTNWVVGPRVLDAGCGDGETLLALVDALQLTGAVGIDFSPAMIARAMVAAAGLRSGVRFVEGSLFDPIWERFDTVYTERALINLPTWRQQAFVLARLADAVAPGGRLCIMENCADGLRALNRLRSICQLDQMSAPAHNRYLEAEEIMAFQPSGFTMPVEVRYSDHYYFLSRVVNAYDAAQRGEAPRYDSPINFLAVGLRTVLGPSPLGCGQGRLWIWRREA